MSLPADRGRPSCFGDAERSGAGTASAALPLPGYSTGVEPVLPVQDRQHCWNASRCMLQEACTVCQVAAHPSQGVGQMAASFGPAALLKCERWSGASMDTLSGAEVAHLAGPAR